MTETHLFRPAAIAVIRLSTKRRDLKFVPIFDDQQHAKLPANRNGFGEQFFGLLRRGIRGDVVILGLVPQEKITHAATHPKRFEARIPQATNNFGGRVAHQGSLSSSFSAKLCFCLKSRYTTPPTNPQKRLPANASRESESASVGCAAIVGTASNCTKRFSR